MTHSSWPREQLEQELERPSADVRRHAVSRADPESVLARAWREGATQLVSELDVGRVNRNPGLRALLRRLEARRER